MYIMETKLVTYKNLKIGQEIKGTKEGNSYRGFHAFVKSINPSYVVVEMWRKGGTEEKINTTAMFEVEITEEEFHRKYENDAKEIIINIQNKMCADQIGYHEMWNAWLSIDPYEMAAYCKKEKIKIIGHCTDIIPKTAMFSGKKLDVGVCAEYEDGERFWCHFTNSNIDYMIDEWEEKHEEEY